MDKKRGQLRPSWTNVTQLEGRSQLGHKYLLSGVSRNISVCITPLSTSRLIFSLLYPP